MAELLRSGEKRRERPGRLLGEVTPLFDKAAYCAMLEKARRHIYEGDIFQIVLSNRLSAAFEGSLLGTYRMLRTINPSPYMFYFAGTDVEVAGASPETLVKLEDGVLHTFPLAGTRPRGKTEAEGAALERNLLADEKELAEHNMLVDLGKISRFGTVEVEKLHSIERYSHVMYIGSTVRGIIREDKDALDAIEAVLPAGTLSGAPKIRACQLIGELENNKCGIYGGAIGYIDFIVSSLGVTGTRSEIKTDLVSIVEVVRRNTKTPCAIGFGISTPEQAHKMAAIADGAIVGSAIIKLLERYGKDAPDKIGAYVKSMKDAL